MKTTIRAYSSDYKLWVLGLYHNNKEWGSRGALYYGGFFHTKHELQKIYNEEISDCMLANRSNYSLLSELVSNLHRSESSSHIDDCKKKGKPIPIPITNPATGEIKYI